MITWINAADRGLQYGDGVFETMRVRGGGIRLLDHHLERLAAGCKRLGLRLPAARRLRRELEDAAAGRREAVLKLIVTRGVGQRGYRPTGRERGTRIVSLHALARRVLLATQAPVRVRMCATRIAVSEALAGMKTLNRLESVLARSEWTAPGIWEGLMRDTEEHIVCGTMTNVFVRRGAFLMTPMIDRCGVSGVMRRWVLEQAATMNLRAVEGRLHWEDLDESIEMFVTNAVAGVVAVRSIEFGRQRIRLGAHETADALRRRLELL